MESHKMRESWEQDGTPDLYSKDNNMEPENHGYGCGMRIPLVPYVDSDLTPQRANLVGLS